MINFQYLFALLTAFSFVFAAEVQGKHAAEKTRSRVLNEMSKSTRYQST
ncbi:MAG: hypothetical protein ACH350_01250 [Parachlamydiaceae bacterium]